MIVVSLWKMYVMHEEGMQNLGWRLVLMLMRAGILVGGSGSGGSGDGSSGGGIVSFSEERCLSVMEVEC